MELNPSDMITLMSLVVPPLSLIINIIPLWRDKQRIDFSLYLADLYLFHQGKVVKEGDYYAFRIVNSGKRSITITHVGGVTPEVNFLHYWIWRLTGLFAPRMFIINDPDLTTLLKDSSGNARILKEGEYSFGSVRVSGGMTARQFHVIDSLGRYHRLPWSAHRKLNNSVKEMLSSK